MINTMEVQDKMNRLNKSLLSLGYDWDFIEKFWIECLEESKITA